jgi:predicted O-methyltransferase YrrM
MRNHWLEKRLSTHPRILNTFHRLKLVEAISQTNEAELSALANYARDTRLALEIGSFQGVSAAKIARNMPVEGILYCVDPWPSRASHRNPCLEIFERHACRTGISHKLRIIQDLSENVLHRLPAEFDFIFVDGDHSLRGISSDWVLVKEKLRQGGIVCLHDVLIPSSEPWRRLDSTDYFETVIQNDLEFRTLDQVHSLAVLRRV